MLSEDLQVVLSQRPAAAAGNPPDMLIGQDAAIRHYRSLTEGFVETAFAPPRGRLVRAIPGFSTFADIRYGSG